MPVQRFHGVARIAEIADAQDLIGLAFQQDEVARRARAFSAFGVDQQRSPAFYGSGRGAQPAHLGVVAEVARHGRPPVQAQPAHQFQPHFLGQHVAQAIEVPRIEAIRVDRQQRLVRRGQGGRRNRVVGLLGQLAQPHPATVQRRLDGGQGGVQDFGRFVERIAQHVGQDDGAALRGGQAHEGAQRHRGHMAAAGIGLRVHLAFRVCIGKHRFFSRPAAQEVHRRVVRDAEQPAFGVLHGLRVVAARGFHQGFLDDVFGVQDRSGHAGAIAVQPGRSCAIRRANSGSAGSGAVVFMGVRPGSLCL